MRILADFDGTLKTIFRHFEALFTAFFNLHGYQATPRRLLDEKYTNNSNKKINS